MIVKEDIKEVRGIAKQPMRMKNFFLFSLSIAILCVCGTSSFLLWKNVQEKKEKIVALKEKKARLDEYYISELRAVWFLTYNTSKSKDLVTWAEKWFEKTTANMLKDGYDRAEIDSLSMKIHNEISDRLS